METERSSLEQADPSEPSPEVSSAPSPEKVRFSLWQLLLGTALVGVMLAFYVRSPIYGKYFVLSTLIILVGWGGMIWSNYLDPREIELRKASSKRLGITGAMLLWVGIVMMIYCLPACLVEMNRTADRLKDYDLYLKEQGQTENAAGSGKNGRPADK